MTPADCSEAVALLVNGTTEESPAITRGFYGQPDTQIIAVTVSEVSDSVFLSILKECNRFKWDNITTTQRPSNRPIGEITTTKWDVISEAPDGGEIRLSTTSRLFRGELLEYRILWSDGIEIFHVNGRNLLSLSSTIATKYQTIDPSFSKYDSEESYPPRKNPSAESFLRDSDPIIDAFDAMVMENQNP